MELKEYIQTVMKRKWLIISIVLVACILSGIKGFFYTTPVYSASAKLVVNQSYEYNGISMLDYNLIQTNLMVINSYKEIIKSKAIMDKVAAAYPDLGLSSDQLISGVSVSSSNESQIMDITFASTSYPQAAKAVNAIAKIFKGQNPSIMKVDNVTVLNEANVSATNPHPINMDPFSSLMISFIVSAMLAVGLAFLLDYMDDTIKTERDIEKALELPMLTLITKMDRSELKRKRPSKPQSHTSTQVGESTYVPAK
ncbi:lipopolysaccharide biosynthesis protein [Paenibacillus curdlanolyticus YK9]|uniref:Lipopolysaccharide biosynthesis protein n=1 Tax=Paenibacillus curdlanolyticus YK9 TaxID=717606 RepID=E0I7B6_9BACL|nr:Wzz/FepE/Etk N-terminal domain-containing protein [Paenibacillus curdlanolyticus]EFM11932.1 lipopolysaccharide biosynthesis protein [Paenibacillus curdlanolyticus YK9]